MAAKKKAIRPEQKQKKPGTESKLKPIPETEPVPNPSGN